MSTVFKISRYHIANNFKLYFILIAAALLLHIIASVAVDTFIGPEREAAIMSPLVLVAVLVLGETIFPSSFTYLLSQGISRKTYWITALLNIAIVSLICSLMVTVYFILMINIVESIGFITLYEGLYHTQNIVGLLVWEFSILFMLGTIGWLDRVVVYRTGRKIRIITTGGFVMLWILLTILNSTMDGAILQALGRFFSTILGQAGAVPDPYIAVLSFLTFTAGLSGIIYLLIRRAPVND